MSRLIVVSCVVLFIGLGCQRAGPPSAGPLEGAWRLREVRLTGPEGESVEGRPLPGLYLFTREHYSIVRMLGPQLPPDNDRLWHPTMAEKARQHDAIIVNAGMYEVNDSILTTHPMAAKTPEFIGGRTIYTWSIVADSLWLTTLDIRSRDEVQDPFVGNYRLVIKLVRSE
ncbi:MAG: lipocalin-like domain-containing protein [Gemmatimonadales bacterium]